MNVYIYIDMYICIKIRRLLSLRVLHTKGIPFLYIYNNQPFLGPARRRFILISTGEPRGSLLCGIFLGIIAAHVECVKSHLPKGQCTHSREEEERKNGKEKKNEGKKERETRDSPASHASKERAPIFIPRQVQHCLRLLKTSLSFYCHQRQ